MPITRAVGTVSEILNVYIDDTRNVSSQGLPNISSSSVQFSWMRNNQATISSGTCSSNTVLGTYSTAAFTQISSTSSRGWYQFGVPDGAFASGRSVVIRIFGAQAGFRTANIEVDLLGSVSPVSVSSMLVDVGVSTIAVAEKLVGVSTIAAAQKLVGTSTMTTPVGVSSASVNLGISSAPILIGVSTLAASVSSVTGAVHVTSAGVNFGVSTLATSVSSVTGQVAVSTIAVAEKLVGVSTVAVSEKLVGVSTIAAAQKLVGVSTVAADQKLVGVSTLATQVDVSTMSVTVGVSTMSTSVDVSSASVLIGVSTLATSVDVSSSIMVSSNTVQINGATVQGDGTSGNLWRG